MAKKAYNNYDDTLFGQYIRQIENADSAGWNASDRIWRAPQRKGLDKRNRGMGVDVLNNLDTKALTKNRPGQYLTEKEEHQLRNAHIQYLLDVINRRKEEDNPALKNMSPKKQAQVLGIMYRGDAPELWKENTILGKALISDKDEDMDKAIKDFYESKGLGERAKNDSIFWNNQKTQNKPKAAAVPQTHINNTVEYQDAIKTYRPAIIPSQTKRDTKKAMQDKVDFHNFMDSISIQNNLPPAYTSKSNIHSEGGFMYKPRDAWEALSMPEKAEMMKVAVKNGITNLQDIRQKYNEFAEGGNIYKEGGKKKSSNANSSAQRAMRYFMDKGLTDYQAAGLVGNLMRESGMNPQALNKGSKAYGLAQWLGPRKKALFARYGNNPTLENQLDFIWSELNSTHKNGLRHLRSSRSAEEAARNAMGYYEFSAGPEAAIANMRKYGQDGEGSMRKGISFASNLMGQPIPAYNTRQNEAVQLSLQESAVPSEGFIYTPLNPQVFGIADTPSYTINVPDQTLPSEPQAEESSVSLYSPKELDRQERMDRLSAFNNVLRMTSPQGNGNVFLDAIEMLTGNAFAEGGGIHIKPSKKGTFTAAASKHGMGVQEFASMVLANKEDYSPAMVKKANFAKNASKWHGFGGNLFDGTTENSQQMTRPNIFQRPDGSYFYSADGIETDVSPINVLGDNPAQWTYSDASGKIYRPVQALPNNYTLTETEDANPLERAASNYFRELDWRAKNDPSSITLQGKYTMPLVLSPVLGKAAATALVNPYVDAALTSGFGAHGLQSLANGEADWTTALEIAPLGRLAKPMWNAGKEAVYNIADRYMFMPHQNSFTRGIGGEAGLQDLVESDLVRGNPVGTEVTANMFGKMNRKNRWHFRDIMDATNRKGIAQRYFNRTLSEEDFDAIKKAAEPYVKEYNALPEKEGWVISTRNPDPLEGYLDYNDYRSVLSQDRKTLTNATSLDDSGQPLAYFYDDGRNPLTAGHDYAASDYGVRINNASEYNPRIFDGHLHYSMPEAVPLRDPNVEVFKKGPFGLTYKLDKETMKPVWQRDLKTLFSKGTNKVPQITAENAASITPEQWTAAQDAAIARGDMAEAQRLRDLHFKVGAPSTKQSAPMFNASGKSTFNEFNGGDTGLNWFSESEKYAANHGVPRAFYINEPNIYFGNVPAWVKGTPVDERYIESLRRLGYSEKQIAQKVQSINEAANSNAPAAKSIGMGANNELVTKNNNTAKLADAVTYDDNGIRIPLGERDNFNINDIRYGLIPFLGLGAAGTLYGKQE